MIKIDSYHYQWRIQGAAMVSAEIFSEGACAPGFSDHG